MIKFFYNLSPNPMTVALVLEEAGLPYEPIPVDTRKGEQHAPAFRALNPNAKVPVIVDDDDDAGGDDHEHREGFGHHVDHGNPGRRAGAGSDGGDPRRAGAGRMWAAPAPCPRRTSLCCE